MPQASDELCDLMIEWFGDLDTSGPMQLLESRGWTETSGMYSPPCSAYYNEVDWLCIQFLVHEWDFDVDKSKLFFYVRDGKAPIEEGKG